MSQNLVLKRLYGDISKNINKSNFTRTADWDLICTHIQFPIINVIDVEILQNILEVLDDVYDNNVPESD